MTAWNYIGTVLYRCDQGLLILAGERRLLPGHGAGDE